jgi:sugar/nucleoside kinase (ribokinase family)
MAQASLLLPNEAEALALTGQADLAAPATALTAAGAQVVIKLGARGVLCADGPRRWRVRPPELEPADTTRAGDCFNAGLLAGLTRGLPLAEAAALGCAAGAASTQAAGGTASAPRLPEVLAAASTQAAGGTASAPRLPEALAAAESVTIRELTA